MRTEARRGGNDPRIIAGVRGERAYPDYMQTAPFALVGGLLDPPEVRAELVAYLKSAITHHHYHVPVELVAQSIIECWAPCLHN